MTEEFKNLHHWDVLGCSCIDGRFVKRIVEWMSGQIGDVFDYRTGVGSSKAIIDSLYDRGDFFDVIKTAVKLHEIKEIWLFDHIDCGAYGGSKHFGNDAEKEHDFHVNKLNEAAAIITQEFPHLKVRKMYIDWEKVEEV